MSEQIPEWTECAAKVPCERTSLETFIYENEPQGDSAKFRGELTNMLNFVWNNAIIGASAEVEEYPGLKAKILKHKREYAPWSPDEQT